MKLAILLVESNPNYDLDFCVLDLLAADQLASLDTYVQQGEWQFLGVCAENGIENVKDMALRLFAVPEGNVSKVKSTSSIDVMLKSVVHVVQFDSIRRRLALELHEKLKDNPSYLGLIEIIPELTQHRAFFSCLSPRFKIEGKKLFVLHSGEDDEWLAKEILDRSKERFPRLHQIARAKDVGFRFTALDRRETELGDFAYHLGINLLTEEWENNCEHAIYKLRDVVPEAAEDLRLAIEELKVPRLSPAISAQVAVNLRRCMDKFIDVINPPKGTNDKRKPRERLKDYINANLRHSVRYADYLNSEAMELTTRIDNLYDLLNDGVHSDWLHSVFTLVTLRLVMLLGELLTPIRPSLQSQFIDTSLFDPDAY